MLQKPLEDDSATKGASRPQAQVQPIAIPAMQDEFSPRCAPGTPGTSHFIWGLGLRHGALPSLARAARRRGTDGTPENHDGGNNHRLEERLTRGERLCARALLGRCAVKRGLGVEPGRERA